MWEFTKASRTGSLTDITNPHGTSVVPSSSQVFFPYFLGARASVSSHSLLLFLAVYVCVVCTHVNILGVHMYVHVCVYEHQRLTSGIPQLMCLGRVSPLGPQLPSSVNRANHHVLGISCLSLPSAGIQGSLPRPQVSVCPQTCLASISPAEPSLQLLFQSLLYSLCLFYFPWFNANPGLLTSYSCFPPPLFEILIYLSTQFRIVLSTQIQDRKNTVFPETV